MKIENPCGCVADDKKWITLCQEHKLYHEGCVRASDLTSILRLISDYERDPTDDNLKHVVARIVKHGDIIATNPEISKWVLSHRQLLAAHRRAAG